MQLPTCTTLTTMLSPEGPMSIPPIMYPKIGGRCTTDAMNPESRIDNRQPHASTDIKTSMRRSLPGHLSPCLRLSTSPCTIAS